MLNVFCMFFEKKKKKKVPSSYPVGGDNFIINISNIWRNNIEALFWTSLPFLHLKRLQVELSIMIKR